MNSTLERKVFKQGVKPSRRVLERSAFKKALMSGVSAAVTAAMLGVSGSAVAALADQTLVVSEEWGDGANSANEKVGVTTNLANTNVNLGGYTLTIDDTGAAVAVGNVTGNGNILIETESTNAGNNNNIGSSSSPVTINRIDVTNVDIKSHNANNANVFVKVTDALNTSGYLKLWSDETGNDGNVTLTVGGNLTVDNAEFTGSGGDNARGNMLLELQGGTNQITNGRLILDASSPGTGGKATLSFTGTGAQEFTGRIVGKHLQDDNGDGAPEGDGILLISAGGPVTFNSEIGGKNAANQDRPLFKIQLKKTAAGSGSTAIFKQSVAALGNDPADSYATGIYLGEGDGAGKTYTATFDASNVSNNVLTVNSIVIGNHKDDTSKIIVTGNGKTVEQSANRPWGYKPHINAGVTPPSSIIDKARISELEIKNGVTFNSHATISAKKITLDAGTTSSFNETVTVSDTLKISGAAMFMKQVMNAAGSTLNLPSGGSVTYHAENNLPGIGTITGSGGKIILTGTPLAAPGKTVLGGTTNTNAITATGTIVVDLGPASGFNLGDYVIIVDGEGPATVPANFITRVDETSSTVDFRQAESTDPAYDASQIRIVAVPVGTGSSSSNPGLPIISGITHISDRMLNRAADAISSRTKFHRFAKYRQTGFRATDFYRSRQADERGFQRTDERGFREADERGFQKTDDRRFREGDERGFQKSDDRRFREGDEREFQKANERKLREADEGKFDKDERERKLEEKLHEHGDGNLHKPDGRMIQKPAEHPTGVSFGDSARVAENAWFETFGDWVEQDAARSSDNAYDVDGYDAEIYGLAFGVDTEVAKDTLLGVSFSYSNADVDWEGSSNAAGDVDHYQLTLYGEYRHDKFYLEGMLGYAMNDYEVSDLYGGAVRNSEFDSDQYLAKMELGVPIYMGNELFLTPKGELTWSHLDVDNYTQTGAVSTNLLVVNPNDWESATATLGAEIHQRIKKDKGYIIPWAYAGVSYDLTGEEASVRAALTSAPTNFYSLQGIDNEQFAGELEFGLEYEVGPWSVGAKYQGQFKSSRDTHSASLLAEYKF
uniref:Autotransporter beta-domain-containing protein n=1 Tax=Candidatus Kentrum sp. TC TaxID=2126339 RepID=A0A450ZMR3_9GAMM|nr:MAG: Autotransporter beta-domain-containing protein [Candidatus Kentron sp. TC]